MQGIIQNNTYTRSEKVTYTEAVDFWAVGVMTFQILTGRDPFRPREIGEYTTGKLHFPTRRLHQVKASDEACRFVQSLMTPQPHLRPNARECLNNYWLQSHTALPGASGRSSRSDLKLDRSLREQNENTASYATWASEEVSRVNIEERTSEPASHIDSEVDRWYRNQTKSAQDIAQCSKVRSKNEIQYPRPTAIQDHTTQQVIEGMTQQSEQTGRSSNDHEDGGRRRRRSSNSHHLNDTSEVIRMDSSPLFF
jgi:serine/threonine protein kinase